MTAVATLSFPERRAGGLIIQHRGAREYRSLTAMLSQRHDFGGQPSRSHSLLLPASRHARFDAGEIAACRLNVGGGLDLLEHLQRRPTGVSCFREPLGTALAPAQLAECIAEVVLGLGPLERHVGTGSNLERRPKGGNRFVEPLDAALALAERLQCGG